MKIGWSMLERRFVSAEQELLAHVPYIDLLDPQDNTAPTAGEIRRWMDVLFAPPGDKP